VVITVVSVNELILHWAWLLFGWVTGEQILNHVQKWGEFKK